MPFGFFHAARLQFGLLVEQEGLNQRAKRFGGPCARLDLLARRIATESNLGQQGFSGAACLAEIGNRTEGYLPGFAGDGILQDKTSLAAAPQSHTESR